MSRWSENPFVIGVRSAIFHLISSLITLVFLIFLPFLWAPARIAWAILSWYVWTQVFALRLICGQSYQLVSDGPLPTEPVVYACQHQAMWETIFLPVLFNNPVVFLKEEILGYPVAGPVARKFDYVGLDRSGATDKARAAFAKARDLAGDGRSFLIFPSGTRDPAKRDRVEKGVAVLYRAMKLPVVPIILNSGDFWPHKSWLRRPGVITVRVLPTIDPGLKTAAFMTQLEQDLRTSL